MTNLLRAEELVGVVRVARVDELAHVDLVLHYALANPEVLLAAEVLQVDLAAGPEVGRAGGLDRLRRDRGPLADGGEHPLVAAAGIRRQVFADGAQVTDHEGPHQRRLRGEALGDHDRPDLEAGYHVAIAEP